MGRSSRFRNNRSKRSRSSSKRTQHDIHKHVKSDNIQDNSAKKRKVETRTEEISSDSSDEDNFSSLLSSLNVPVSENAIVTDESEDSEDEESDANSDLFDIDGKGPSPGQETIELDTSDGEEGEDDDNDGGDSDTNLLKTSENPSSCSEFEDIGDDVNDASEAKDSVDNDADPFVKHFKYDLPNTNLEAIQSVPPKVQSLQESWSVLGTFHVSLPKVEEELTSSVKSILGDNITYASLGTMPKKISSVDWSQLHVKAQLHKNLIVSNEVSLGVFKDRMMTDLQRELFSVINNYQDLYFPSRNLENGEEIRFIYCLHSLNHILKTRTLIVNHNTKLQNKNDVPDEYRDQGLVRPKILIVVPFKDAAFKVINLFMSFLGYSGKGQIFNKSRFIEEFTGDELAMPRKNPRPEDYEKLFSGNTDDNFKIGLSITRKSLKLYTDFYSSDIIVASPLGLRIVIGAEGEESRDYDFLASIEMLILDQTEVFLMQNWDHILHIMNHLHLQPKESHGTDFARVRSWAINGWTNFYRQTLIFSSVTLPEINSIFNKRCHNYAGKVRVDKFIPKGVVCQVVVQIPQVFHKFSVPSGQSVTDYRFEFFVKKILPQFSDTLTSHVLIYVPSYFDYVRIRNFFKREEMNFVQICEYSKERKIARARDLFYHKEAHFMLYSERSHFFRRLRIKGIRHIIFYQPPSIPHFYSEMCNFIIEDTKRKNATNESDKNITVLYTKFDCLQLSALVGTERAARMLSSERNVNMFVSGE